MGYRGYCLRLGAKCLPTSDKMNSMIIRAWPASAIAFALLVSAPWPLLPQTRPSPGAWVESKGARVHVPDGWSYNERLAAASGPLNITNFGGAYSTGGLMPPEGAEIEITSVPSPPNLVEYVRKELKAAKVDKLQEMTAGEKSGIRASYVESISPDASLKTVVVYIARGPSLYKFFLSYWTSNRNEASLATAFEQVIKEAQLR
jgi:hypothetical protein